MKNLHSTAVLATALFALVAAPSAFAGESALSAGQCIKYAKALNSAAPADSTNVVKSTIAEVVAAAGDKAQQAVGEAAAALAAVATVKGESDSAGAAALFGNVVAAASAAGSDKAESLGLAKVAAAAGALASGGADFVSGAGEGLSKSVAKEVKNAVQNADEALAGLDAFAIKQAYDAALEALRGGTYKMRADSTEDSISSLVPITGLDSREEGAQLPPSGVYLSGAVVLPPKKKEKKNPTQTGADD